MSVNLLPPKYQPKSLVEWKRLRKILLVAIMAFAIGFASANYYFYRLGLKEAHANLAENINNLKPVFNKIQDYEATLQTVQKIDKLADKIGKAKEIWSNILADIAGSLKADIWFVQISKEEDQVIIEGEARNFSAVGNLAVNLRKLQWFKQVDVSTVDRLESEIPENSYNSIILTENVKFKITAVLQDNIKLFSPPEGGAQ